VITLGAAVALVFFYAPNDADQGFIQKIFYVHVPVAIVTLIAYVVGAVFAALHLRTRDRSWLSKIRPMYGHDYHFHIRITCPAGSRECESQPAPPGGDGCRPADLAYWFKDSVLHPKPPTTPPKPRPPVTLAQLPADCRRVLAARDAKP